MSISTFLTCDILLNAIEVLITIGRAIWIPGCWTERSLNLQLHFDTNMKIWTIQHYVVLYVVTYQYFAKKLDFNLGRQCISEWNASELKVI